MKHYDKALEIITNDSKQSGISVKDLLNDIHYIIELANALQISFELCILLTNYIELKVC